MGEDKFGKRKKAHRRWQKKMELWAKQRRDKINERKENADNKR